MVIAKVGAIMSMLAFTSEMGSASSTLDFVGHFFTNERTVHRAHTQYLTLSL